MVVWLNAWICDVVLLIMIGSSVDEWFLNNYEMVMDE